MLVDVLVVDLLAVMAVSSEEAVPEERSLAGKAAVTCHIADIAVGRL